LSVSLLRRSARFGDADKKRVQLATEVGRRARCHRERRACSFRLAASAVLVLLEARASSDRSRGVTLKICAEKISKEEKLRLNVRRRTLKNCHAGVLTDAFQAFLDTARDNFITGAASPNLIANSLS
jgi:hypothetical protein